MEYNERLEELFRDPPDGFAILASHYDDSGEHPETFVDYECAFAASMLRELRPARILDVGSYRNFVMGLAASYNVTSIDVRRRFAMVEGEECLVADAKGLPMPPCSFDAVVSLCSLEHFGLGRYGDGFDLHADTRAFREMVRVLQPGGHLIFSTTVTSGHPCLCFNAHRIYSYRMIEDFCSIHGLSLVREMVYRKDTLGFSRVGSQTAEFGCWDIYLGCWRK